MYQKRKRDRAGVHFLEFLRHYLKLPRPDFYKTLGWSRAKYHYHVSNDATFELTPESLKSLEKLLNVSSEEMERAVNHFLFK